MKHLRYLLLLPVILLLTGASPHLLVIARKNVEAGEAPTTFGSIDFDGTDDSVTIGNLNMPASTTVSMWIKPDTANGDSWRLFSKATGTATDSHYFMVGSDGGTPARLRCRIKADSDVTDTLIASSGTLTTGVWHHVAVTYNSSDGATEIYLNGSSVGSATHSTAGDIVGGAVATRIGANGEGSNYFNGKITNVKVWSVALTSGNISTDYGDGKGGNSLTTNQVHRWILDDGADTTSADGDTIADSVGSDDGTGSDGANNTGLLYSFESL